MHHAIESAINQIDAMVFSGDDLLNPHNAERFRELLARWGRGLAEADETRKSIEEMD